MTIQSNLFHLSYIYTIILLKYVCLSVLANCRSKFLLDCLRRCLKLFVSTESTSCHEFASQFGQDIFLYMKNGHNYSICILCWSNGDVYRWSFPTMFCKIVLHDLFVDIIKAYTFLLINILHLLLNGHNPKLSRIPRRIRDCLFE